MLASDVALYKDILVARLPDSAFIYFSLKRCMAMGREHAQIAQIEDLEQ